MVAVRSHVGNKYRQPVVQGQTPHYVTDDGIRMEDAHAVFELKRGKRSVLHLAIADGHGSEYLSKGVYRGGRECADVACDTAVQELSKTTSKSINANDMSNAHRLTLKACQEEMRRRVILPNQFWSPEGVRMVKKPLLGETKSFVPACGTTLSLLTITQKWGVFTHVGDSVGVLARQNGETMLLGVPHSPHDHTEATRLKAAGATIMKGAHYFKYKVLDSTMRMAVTRSLGHFGHTPVLAEPTQSDTFVPQMHDRICIATDGLWDGVSRNEAAQILRTSHTESEACKSLLQLRLTRHPHIHDNTIIVCHFIKEHGIHEERTTQDKSSRLCCIVC